MLGKLGDLSKLRVCYEAGPTGYVLYWQLIKLGVHCEVIAPSLVPVKPGERVKTDRRDAEKLARAYRSGELTAVFVPDAEHEALRDLVRAREAAKKDELRARHRLSKYLLRNGRYAPAGSRAWTLTYWRWVRTLQFEHAAQSATLLDYIAEVEHQGQRIERLEKMIDEAIASAPAQMMSVVHALLSLRVVAKITAVTLAVEVGTFRRFERAQQLMSYTGMVPSEHSSGGRRQQGAITKTGNNHLRRVLIEAAWHYRHRPSLSNRQRALQKQLDGRVLEIAWNAQLRLNGATDGWTRAASHLARWSRRLHASSSASSGRSAQPPKRLRCRATQPECRSASRTGQWSSAATERRILESVMRHRPASLVRGSSRWIMSMRRALLDPRISA